MNPPFPSTYTHTLSILSPHQTNSDPMSDNISAVSRTPAVHTEPQEELHYSSVHFPPSTNHDVSLYSNTKPPQTQEDVHYAAVNFNPSSK